MTAYDENIDDDIDGVALDACQWTILALQRQLIQ